MNLRISIVDIFIYVDGTTNSRCIKEAERILDARHLVTCGVLEKSTSNFKIFGMCMQTSALSSPPHKIECELFVEIDTDVKIRSVNCSCVAGAAGKCKHSVAVLLYCNRNDISTLEELSVTDIECIWSNRKEPIETWYEVVPLQDFCHVSVTADDHYKISDVQAKRYLEEFIGCRPNSALAKHMQKRRDLNKPFAKPIACSSISTDELQLKVILERELLIVENKFSNYLHDLPSQLLNFYNTNIKVNVQQAMHLAKQSQGNDEWTVARSKRFTGSHCYELYTYCANKAPNWEKKLNSIYNSSFKGNAATAYGLKMEPIAKELYTKNTNNTVIVPGILVHPNIPWIGYSPDGIIVEQDGIALEIKSPTHGEFLTLNELMKCLPYVIFNEETGQFGIKKNINIMVKFSWEWV